MLALSSRYYTQQKSHKKENEEASHMSTDLMLTRELQHVWISSSDRLADVISLLILPLTITVNGFYRYKVTTMILC